MLWRRGLRKRLPTAMPLLGILFLLGCQSPKPLLPNAVSLPRIVTETADDSLPSDPDALALWRENRRASKESPLSGQLEITRWSKNKSPSKQVVNLLEGTGGRYRLTYIAPDSVAGRILLCDGKEMFQYEPGHNALLRRTDTRLDDVLEDANAATSLPVRRPAIRPSNTLIAGRTVTILEMYDRPTGRLRERRWMDNQTHRSLRIETYTAKGDLARRLQVVYLDATMPPDSAFRPDFPTVRTMHTGEPTKTPRTELRRLGMPIQVGSYTFRSLIRPQNPQIKEIPTQLLYSDGIRVVSLFVSDSSFGSRIAADKHWKPIMLTTNITGYRREDGHGSTILWMQNGRRIVAVAHLPMSALVGMVRGLVTASNQ